VSSMHRLRRGALPAAVAVVGVLALSGCRSEPDVAIYINDATYSQQRVDKLAAELKAIPEFKTGDARKLVAQWIVKRDVAKQMLTVRKIALPPVQLQETAQQSGLPPTGELIKLYAEYQAYNGAIQQRATPAEPSPAEFTDLFKRAQAAGIVEKGSTEAAFRQGLGDQNLQLFATNLGIRNIYNDGIKRAHVTVNPRYGDEVALLSDNAGHALVVMSLNSKPNNSAVAPRPA
jgi:hypothetical protein